MDSMDNIKGIIFSLESLLKESKKAILSNKIAVDANKINQLVEKLKEAINTHETTQQTGQETQYTVGHATQQSPQLQENNTEVIDAQKVAFKMKKDADDYADGILSRLQLLVTKMQTNVIKMEKNISEGRRLIEQKHLQHKGETYEEH
jgi:hypothetical protein